MSLKNSDQQYSLGSAMPTQKERQVLNRLANQVLEIAHSPNTLERKSAWKNSNNLKPTRPVTLVETIAIKGFKDQSALECTDPFLRDIEKSLRESIRHYNEINDDFVVEPYFRLPWKISCSGMGVDFGEHHAVSSNGDDTGYVYDYPIKTKDNLLKLKHNEYRVLRRESTILMEKTHAALGDVLPVLLAGIDAIFTESDGIFSLNADAKNADGTRRFVGYTPFIGSYFIGFCMSMFKLLGNDNLIFWCYDNPETFQSLAEFVMKDRENYFHWLENENLLASNTDNQIIGSGPYGYISDLPTYSSDRCGLKNIWGWAEGQEAGLFSPDMFQEFFLPYLAQIANEFGFISYGCCEKIDDRIHMILKKIKNIRSFAVSPWNDDCRLAEIIGRKYTYCRKIMPTNLAMKHVEWDPIKQELETIKEATKECNLQIIIRDLYDVHGDFSRLGKWADLAKSILGN